MMTCAEHTGGEMKKRTGRCRENLYLWMIVKQMEFCAPLQNSHISLL